jgi:hypothetical protein
MEGEMNICLVGIVATIFDTAHRKNADWGDWTWTMLVTVFAALIFIAALRRLRNQG